MITIKYEEYTNDYIRKYKDHTVPFLQSFEDWFFNLCDGDYSKKISIPDPKHSVCKDGPYRMEVNCVWTQNKCYWVHQIMRDGKIIFSDGKFTSGQKYWNEDMKQLCSEMLKRKAKPVFNFG